MTSSSFNLRHVQSINKVIVHAHKFVYVGLAFLRQDRATLHMVAYSDTSLGTNENGSSHLWFFILLMDGAGKVCVISFASGKSKRVVRLVLGPEVLAFAVAVDEAMLLRHDL